MSLFQKLDPNLRDANGSIEFSRRVKNLIKAVNSRTPMNTLKPGNEMWKVHVYLEYLLSNILCILHSKEICMLTKKKLFSRSQNIEEILDYLREWEDGAQKNNYEFLAYQTVYGSKISLKAAIGICQFLVDDHGFKYLMTGRLNPENLEICAYILCINIRSV